jgi:L-rhamnose mutarotase
MQRIGFILKVKQELLEEYKEAHKNVWPDMRQALSETGWTNYSIFARPDGTLFGYVETPDFDKAKSGMDGREVNARWQAAMGRFFEDLEGKRPDEAFFILEEVFHLD